MRRWGEQWERSKTRDLPAVDELARRLRAGLPDSPPPTIVHGDYRLDNTMLSPTIRARSSPCSTGRWRRSATRSSDMGLFLVYWKRDENAAAGVSATIDSRKGFLTRDEIVARYADASGRDVSQLDFYEILASYKLAIILEGIHARFLMGKTVGDGFEGHRHDGRGHDHGRARPGVEVFDPRPARLTGRTSRHPSRQRREGADMGVLDGVQVLEVAEHGFVPSAAAILADWGADVVKVERPTGDPLRHYASWASSPDVDGFNFLFEQFNRNKRSVAIDLRNDEGRAALDRLIEWADVFVTSFLPSARDEAAARHRRHLGGEPALRLRHRIGPGTRGARRRPGRVRRGVVLGTRRARAHAHPDGRAARHAARRARRRAERRRILAGGISGALVQARAHGRGVGRRRVVARRRGLDARRRPRRRLRRAASRPSRTRPVKRSAAPCSSGPFTRPTPAG